MPYSWAAPVRRSDRCNDTKFKASAMQAAQMHDVRAVHLPELAALML
jgi:hypothetical protein